MTHRGVRIILNNIMVMQVLAEKSDTWDLVINLSGSYRPLVTPATMHAMLDHLLRLNSFTSALHRT